MRVYRNDKDTNYGVADAILSRRGPFAMQPRTSAGTARYIGCVRLASHGPSTYTAAPLMLSLRNVRSDPSR